MVKVVGEVIKQAVVGFSQFEEMVRFSGVQAAFVGVDGQANCLQGVQVDVQGDGRILSLLFLKGFSKLVSLYAAKGISGVLRVHVFRI